MWGGELLVGELHGCERAGHLRPVALPGGDRAAREPWRMACAWLAAAEADDAAAALRARLAAPATWDAVTALRALAALPAHDERRAAVRRRRRALRPAHDLHVRGPGRDRAGGGRGDSAERGAYPLPLDDTADGLVLDARPTILAAAHDAQRDVGPAGVAARFHRALAAPLADACAHLAEQRGLGTVALGGGVWVNRLLLELTATALDARGIRVIVPELLPPGDGGLSYGQAAIAAANDRSRP